MRGRAFLFAGALGLTTALAFLIPQMSRPLTAFDLGLRLLDEGRPTDAVHLFKDVQWQGVAEYRAGRYRRAVAAFASGREVHALYNLGTAYARVHTWDGAKAAFREVLRLDPSHEDAQHNLEIVLQAEEQERQEIAATRDERTLGNFDGNKAGERPELDEDQATKDGTEDTAPGEATATDRQSAMAGQSDAAGTLGQDPLSQEAQSGRAETAPQDDDQGADLAAMSGASSPIRRRSAQSVEILLRQIKDDPDRVLRSRLRAMHLSRTEGGME